MNGAAINELTMKFDTSLLAPIYQFLQYEIPDQ